MFQTSYKPSGKTYVYISDLATDSAIQEPYTDAQIKVLESRGHDVTYPGTWCETLLFGGYVQQISQELHTNDVWVGLTHYNSVSVYLQVPLSNAYNLGSTFVGGEEFGQDSISSFPSYVDMEYSGTDTLIKWYYNNTLINTDTIAGHHLNDFRIAVQYANNVITGYAFVWYEDASLWGSGGRSNADVLTKILNNAGSAVANGPVEGWANPDDPDNPDAAFIISRMYSKPGYTNWLAGGRSGETVASAREDLYNKTLDAGGMYGSDLVTYITDIPDSSAAWDYLMNDPASDMLTFNIPSSDEHDFRIEWHYSDKNFYVYDGETQYSTTENRLNYRTGGVVILCGTCDNGANLGWSMLIRTSGAIVVPQYNFYQWGINESATETQEYDYEQIAREEFNGYGDGAEEGEEDEQQQQPDDLDEPAVDALATGFIYAFAVNQADMQSLAECLNNNTLSGKIKDDFGNHLFDFIVSYHTMPCITNADFNNKVGIEYRGVPFIYGPNDTSLTLAQVTKSFYSVVCGTKKCLPQNVRGNGFENWANAQVQIYLPFIGYQHLNTADVWGREVTVVYYFDVLAGTCTANIGVEGKGTLYTYESSCSYKIPFTATIDTSMQQIMAGVMSAGSALMGTITNAATGNVGGAVASAMGGAGAIGNFISASEHKAIINRGGQLGGSAGWHTPRQPALIVTVPDVVNVTNSSYLEINGYPTFKSVTLASYSGFYVEVAQIDLKAAPNNNGALPNDDELDLIKSALKEGVFV